MASSNPSPPGTAQIKPEYIVSTGTRAVPDDDAAEGGTSRQARPQDDDREEQPSTIGPARGKRDKKEKKGGSNKGRRFAKVRDDLELCWKIASGKVCDFGDQCRNTHDVAAYLAAKPRDIHFNATAHILDVPPFVEDSASTVDRVLEVDAQYPSVDLSTTCPIFAETGACKHGLKCRFLGGHVRKDESGELQLVTDDEKLARTAVSSTEVNFIGFDTMKLLRTKKFPRPITDAYLKELQSMDQDAKPTKVEVEKVPVNGPAPSALLAQGDDVDMDPVIEGKIAQRTGEVPSSELDTPDVPARFPEKKRLHWAGKTYLAPLTTVGNLPFRRLCVGYGADITCGEMGLSNSFLSGSKEEWSLVRRHPSERTFGVQIAGNKPGVLVPAAEVFAKECAGGIDFVDINCGCPIDLVFRTGSGSALLDAAGKLGKIIIGMNKALGDIPVTVKLRTGVKDGRNTAHKLMPRLGPEFGAGCITLHGRTRQQRYTRLADWDYIKQCVDAVRAREADEDLPPIPIFGGGDCFGAQDYWSSVEKSGVDGVMVARGALIKPWIFTEIQEHREWDISARERLEGVRKLAEYGINHFGSDTAGVNTTRRYVCEALSFQYRYVPIGLLEHLPARINDRAPTFRGRDDLETLLASGNSRDWVKISEMFLGPAPEAWSFTPKHKSNAYGTEESQG
ncbi:hypothetical protein PLICRDRAFT_38252 [Plicaturopsis crispa FD-325 SS-3]|nr:hypothetical protein PLICRDRAFT_38252 [Plicaturopsis crispa FD-325 SS-3]